MRFPRARQVWAVAVLGLAGATLPLLCRAGPAAATATSEAWQHALDGLAHQARPAVLGVAVLDLDSGAAAQVNAERAFPMMSVFKAPVAAAVLAKVDQGTLSLQQPVTITREQVLDGSAIPSIGAHFQGEHMSFTVAQLLKAAVSESDNTAVNALIRTVGGPGEVTAYLHAHGIDGMRVDMDEAGVARVFAGLRPGEAAPLDESSTAASQRYQRGYQAFLADPRNRSTPTAAVSFLDQLVRGQLLSPASTQRLLGLMEAQTVPNRLRAGLPPGVRLADKTGTSGTLGERRAAYNDIGILTWPDGHRVLVAAFLSDSPASEHARDALFAEIARRVTAAVHP